MQENEEKLRVQTSIHRGLRMKVVVVDPAELLQLVTFWIGVYFEVLRESYPLPRRRSKICGTPSSTARMNKAARRH